MSASAVCDSGPLTHLWQIELWPVFGTFERIFIAEQVQEEVSSFVDLQHFGSLCGLQKSFLQELCATVDCK